MFISASAYGLARMHGCRFHTAKEIIGELTDNFNISFEKGIWLTGEQIDSMIDFVIENTVCRLLPDMLKPNALKYIELRGYWQSYLYFNVYRDGIREIYSARSETLAR